MTEEARSPEPGLQQYTIRLNYPVHAKDHADAMRRFGVDLLTHGIGELFFRVLRTGETDARIFRNSEQVSTDQQNLDYLREVAEKQPEVVADDKS
ncbi:hypothetical protein [Aquipuribacter sp. MA13-6]|uniref:hypothetical protein n=1 Tax=unclassified Aquipuribacter TaxID=2635084 RepID=UPI003EE9D79D